MKYHFSINSGFGVEGLQTTRIVTFAKDVKKNPSTMILEAKHRKAEMESIFSNIRNIVRLFLSEPLDTGVLPTTASKSSTLLPSQDRGQERLLENVNSTFLTWVCLCVQCSQEMFNFLWQCDSALWLNHASLS
jgi:hypothetical protein